MSPISTVELKFTVLIVDDEATNLLILKNILEIDYNIYEAKSGKEALEITRTLKPDIILLDILMYDMDGFETLARLKNDDVTKNIPVIFITALDAEEDEEKGFQLGAVDYITKPFRRTSVKARVRTHLSIVSYIRALEELGSIDPLTQIPNRRNFDETIEREWQTSIRKNESISIIILDADKFKQYNDTFGHPQGDELLKGLAKTIKDSIVGSRDIVARIGGEEFAVILPGMEFEDARLIAEKIRKSVENMEVTRLMTDEITKITVSIGLSTAKPKVGEGYQSLIHGADKALYTAKSNSGNCICVSPENINVSV